MKNAKGYVQGYNGQAVVTEEQIIVACEVTQQENDLHQLEPMLQATKETLEEAGINESPGLLGADAGYFRDDLDVVELNRTGRSCCLPLKRTGNNVRRKKSNRRPKGESQRMPHPGIVWTGSCGPNAADRCINFEVRRWNRFLGI